MLTILAQIDKGLANEVAYGLGLSIPKTTDGTLNKSIPADRNPERYESLNPEGSLAKSRALSMANTVKDSIETRKVAILAADGVNSGSLKVMQQTLTEAGAVVEVIAPRLGEITDQDGMTIPVKQSFLTAASVFYDAIYVPDGTNCVATLAAEANAVHFLNEAFKHCKAIAVHRDAFQILEETYFFSKLPEDNMDETVLREGIVLGTDSGVMVRQFMLAIAQHRFWEREKPRRVPA